MHLFPSLQNAMLRANQNSATKPNPPNQCPLFFSDPQKPYHMHMHKPDLNLKIERRITKKNLCYYYSHRFLHFIVLSLIVHHALTLHPDHLLSPSPQLTTHNTNPPHPLNPPSTPSPSPHPAASPTNSSSSPPS
jgi:hypothetical protein